MLRNLRYLAAFIAAAAIAGCGTNGAYNPALNGSVTLNPDFTLRVSPSSRSVTQGQSTTYTATVTASDGFASTVNFTVSGLPAGANGNFAPPSITPTKGGANSTLTVTTTGPAAPRSPHRGVTVTPPGNYTLTITASGGGKTKQTTVTLNVTAGVSGSGQKIVFTSFRDGNNEIYSMNPDGSNPVRLTNSAGDDFSPKLNNDGTKIVFVSRRNGNAEIYSMNADGSNQTRLTNNSADDQQPCWSPDGTKIVFRSNRDGGNEIYTMNADGSNVVRVTNNGSNDFGPAWSPDGTKIAFVSDRNGNVNDIYVMNVDGSGVVNLTNGAGGTKPAWSPNGSKIAFDGINVMNADGTGRTHIGPATGSEPSWSPDGTKIAFIIVNGQTADIYTMNADGSNQVRITNTPPANTEPSWGIIP